MGRKTQPIKEIDQEIMLYDYLYEHDRVIYILALMIRYTGFRVGDILGLTKRMVIGDYLEITENKTKYLENKYRREAERKKVKPRKPKPPRKVLLHPSLKRELKEYIKDMENWQVIFPTSRKQRRNKHLSYSQVNRRLDKIATTLGIEDFGTHALRKTCFLRMYEETGDIHKVQHFAGHVSIKDTSKYLGLTQEVNDSLVKKMDDPLRYIKRK